MFGNIAKINDLQNKLDNALAENKRLTDFYEETKDKELKRLTEQINTLTKSNDKLKDAKEAAKKELEDEYKTKTAEIEEIYKERLATTEKEYQSKLRLEADTNASKMEYVESQMANVIENRVKESTETIQLEHKEMKIELKHYKELMDIYKKKFEGGKIELGADEVKGMLLSANPNGTKVIEAMNKI